MASEISKSPRSGSSLRRNLLLGLWIGVVAVGGAYFGARLAARSRPEPFPALQRGVPAFLLAPDAQFPTAQLLGEDGIPRPTEEFLARKGTVILFLDPSCDPCKYAARQWQQLYESGSLGEVEILGISIAAPEAVARYRAQLALAFPIVTDPTQAYASRYGVDTFPWEIIVDGRGRIVSYTGNAREMASLANLGPLLN